MAQLVIELTDEQMERLRADAERQNTSVLNLARERLVPRPRAYNPDGTLSAAALYGAGGRGPGTHGSVEAVDAYLRELREEWE